MTALCLALAGTSHAVAPRTAETPQTVCDGLTSDEQFRQEAQSLGRTHACEHLQVRLESGREPSVIGGLGEAVGARAETATAMARAAAGGPARNGRWSRAKNLGTTVIGITAVLLHTGDVLLFGRESRTDVTTTAYLYDPQTGGGHPVPVPAPIFCGSVTPLSDGRILSVGGADPVPYGIPDIWLFDPVTEQWSLQPESPLGRYYPTSTRMPDGRVVITAGRLDSSRDHNPTVEVYTPPGRGGTVGTLSVVGPEHTTATYPHQLVMRDGRMLQVDRQATHALDSATWSWAVLPAPIGNTGAGAAHLMQPAGPRGSTRVTMIGGLVRGNALATTQHFDYARRAEGWRLGGRLPTPRSHMNVVQVPDGSAYGIGGNSVGLFEAPRRRTLHYDPATDRWTELAVQAPNRTYHSTALLLPGGRILSAGDDQPGGGRHLVDVYTPPYLFKGPRPRVTSWPQRIRQGQAFAIGTAGPRANKAVLMAPGATTHANEMNARHIRLAVTRTRTGFRATTPTANVAPPGHYMLFVLTPDGVPSIARWVHVRR